jgi:hypothetical protein
MEQRPGADAARNDENIGRGRRLEGVLRHDPETVASAHHPGNLRHGVGVEDGLPGERIGHAEDLEGPGEIEHLGLVENEDGDVEAHAGRKG